MSYLIDAEAPHAIHPEQARMELDLYLSKWKWCGPRILSEWKREPHRLLLASL
jgi:hypothetical protein